MLIDRPNHVLQKQRVIQASQYPVHLKTPFGRIAVKIFAVGFTAGILGSVYGITTLIKGK